jgi:hypothetical protein
VLECWNVVHFIERVSGERQGTKSLNPLRSDDDSFSVNIASFVLGTGEADCPPKI